MCQTFTDWECIVWDDRSRDSSFHIANEYYRNQDSDRFKSFSSLVHHGIARTLHDAIQESTAPYIGILDSDDWLEPTCLEKSIQPFLDGWECGLVYTDYWTEWDDCPPVYIGNPPFNQPHLFFPGYCPFHFRLFKRSLYDKVGGVDLSFPCAVDYDLMLRMGEVEPFVHIKEPLYHYRIHDQQISHTHKDEQLLWAKKASQNAIARRGLQDKYEARLSWSISVSRG